MGFFSDLANPLENLGDDLGNQFDGFTGEAGAEASVKAAQIQAQLGLEGLESTLGAQERLEATLAPFVQSGYNALNTNLFGSNAFAEVQNDPAFQAIAEREKVKLLASQAARGRLSTNETAGGLNSLLSNLGGDFLSRQRGDVLSAAQLGQASAAQQAAAGISTGEKASDILTQIGNVTAAGGIGAANAYSQGAQNLGNTALGLAGIFASERQFKRNINLTGIRPNGVKVYTYQYNFSDDWYVGSMVDENPHAVVDCGSYKALNYARL